MKYSTIPRVSARPRRTSNPYMERPSQKHPDAKVKPVGACEYCHAQRANTKDHVIPRSVLRSYNRLAADDAPSVPGEWLELVFSCASCNLIKGNRRLVPMSWRGRVAAMNRFFGGTPWRVWRGGMDEPAYRDTHV